MPPPSLADRLRTYRRARGLTQAELAQALGVRESTVHRWERGRSTPSASAARRLSACGFDEVARGQPHGANRPRLQRKGLTAAEKRAKADALAAQSAIPVDLCGSKARLIPMAWMRNGPPDQLGFHRRLIDMQLEGLSALEPATAARRLSLVEEVSGFGKTPQHQLERPKSTSVSWSSNYGAHGWHRYVGRFPPHVIRALLNRFGAGSSDVVLDPFLGSGTTAVECRLLGVPSIGIEICPLSAMIGRVKAAFPDNPDELEAVAERFNANYASLHDRLVQSGLGTSHAAILEREGNPIPRFTNIEKWFSPEALLGVSAAVEVACKEDGYAREAILVALSSRMRSIGNVDVDVVRAEYRKTPRDNVDVGTLMDRQLRKMSRGARASLTTHADTIGPASSVTVHEASVLELELPDRSVSHVITSPPYGVEAISYLRTHLLSYRSLVAHLGHDPYDTRAQTIGPEYLHAESARRSANASRCSATFRDFFRHEEEEPKLESRRRAMMAFFEDMYLVGARLSDWLIDRGNVAFIVGNKRVGERIIPTDTIIAELFAAVGLTHTESIRHKLKTNNSNSQVPWQERVIQQETLMIFRRESR